jgi:hypothetical protein
MAGPSRERRRSDEEGGAIMAECVRIDGGHEYAEKTCKCGEVFCFYCCGGTNVHQGGKYEKDYMFCPSCGADFYAE